MIVRVYFENGDDAVLSVPVPSYGEMSVPERFRQALTLGSTFTLDDGRGATLTVNAALTLAVRTEFEAGEREQA